MWQSTQGDWFLETMAAALREPATALLALGLKPAMVNLAHEPRPYTVFPDALVRVAHNRDHSFPTDHRVLAGAVAAGALLTHRRLGAATVANAVAAVVMVFARVYVGAHFPLDVVVRLLLGAAVTCLGYLAVRTRSNWAVTGLTRTLLRPLLITGDRSLSR